jgi:hypothetical protein
MVLRLASNLTKAMTKCIQS